MANKELIGDTQDNWNFALVGAGSKFPWRSYISSIDPTNAEPGVLIQGSQNVFKNLRGNIEVRPGLKRRGIADAAIAGTKSSYVWNTSLGTVRPMRVNNGNLQVEFNNGIDLEWYDLLSGLTLTRFVFIPYWNDTLKKDQLLFVKGDTVIHEWSGGIGTIASTSNGGGVISTIDQPGQNLGQSSGGTGYVVNDILTVTGGGGDATIQVDQVVPGGVATLALGNGGMNYAVNDIVALVTPANGQPAEIKVTSVDGGGAITGFILLGSGNGYVSNSTQSVTTTGGTGTDAFFFVDTVGNSISAWHLVKSGTGYSEAANMPTTGGTGTAATVNITAVASGSITLAGTTTVQQQGFEGATGTIVVNGHTYSYTASNLNGGQSFTGLSGDPTGEPVGSIVTQQVVAQNNLPDPTNQNFTNDFIQVINNQLHVGCYNSRFVYVSSDTDYTDFTVPDVRSQGDPDLLTLDSNVRGIAVQRGTSTEAGNAIISGGVGDWYTIVRSQITVGTTLEEQVTVTKSTSADLATALAHEFIDNIGGDIIFLDQNNQLREFGTVRNISTPVFPLLSLDIFTELQNLDFTGGQIAAIADEGGETVYVVCPLAGVDYDYQIRQKIDSVGNLTAERIWQPPQVRGISRMAVIDGVTYGHSNANPQIYRLWNTNQWHDDSPSNQALPYVCHALGAYLNEGRTNLLIFDKLFAEGYMTQGSVVGCNVFMEYQGSKNDPFVVLNNPAKGQKHAKFYIAENDASLGENSLGDNPLGDGLTLRGGVDALFPKFRCIRDVTGQKIFEYALDVWSETADTRWELLSLGVNQTQATDYPVFIRQSS